MKFSRKTLHIDIKLGVNTQHCRQMQLRHEDPMLHIKEVKNEEKPTYLNPRNLDETIGSSAFSNVGVKLKKINSAHYKLPKFLKLCT
jgi:hypothetical protein